MAKGVRLGAELPQITSTAVGTWLRHKGTS
jgi:hypothetical protein